MSKLKLTAIGHLGNDCSIKHLDSGTSAINFSIACTEKYKDRAGNSVEQTTWVDCTLWRKPDKMKIAEYLKKGTLVCIEGKPAVRGYATKNDPNKIVGVLMLRVDDILLLSKPASSGSQSASNENSFAANDAGNQPVIASDAEDDLPF